MKLDLLVFGAHPDDAELSCGGTILRHIDQGKKVGIVDLTRGELGTRGSKEIRESEAIAASKILGIHARENLNIPDGGVANNQEQRMKVVMAVRKFQPEIVLAPAKKDRHPDHTHGAALVADACFLSGLSKIITSNKEDPQKQWRPKAVYHYIQSRYLEPDFVVDISQYMAKKMEVVKAYESQFFNPDAKEAATFISSKAFMELLRSRAQHFGYPVGIEFGEGYTTDNYLVVSDIFTVT